ncbi:unnamed protein product, partial [Rotaria sordida]
LFYIYFVTSYEVSYSLKNIVVKRFYHINGILPLPRTPNNLVHIQRSITKMPLVR